MSRGGKHLSTVTKIGTKELMINENDDFLYLSQASYQIYLHALINDKRGGS